MLVLQNIGKTYPNGVNAVDGVSLEVAPGEILAVVGGSGCGKSTLLRMVSGLDRPSRGRILLDGEPIAAPHERIGIIFQEPRLLPWLTVAGNVGFGIADRPKGERRDRVAAALDRVGLNDKAGVWPRELSGGQAQRAAIARALCMNPKIMLFDEPTSALDPELIGEVLKVIGELAIKGRTSIIVTHELAFARDIASKIVFMDGGQIVEEGPPDRLLTSPKLDRTRAFIARIL